ncbi:MAG TPA: hypothetical protein VGD81_01140 [Opitutaceae bacterium]
MHRLRFLVALVLAALWLPVTLHCTIEAVVEVDAARCLGACHDSSTTTEHDGHRDADHAAGHDGCEIVESGRYKTAFTFLKITPPVATLCACLLCVHEPEIEPDQVAVVSAALERPRDWVPGWHFVRRAAPVSRAPAV